MKTFLQVAVIFLFVLACASALKINEFTADPQTDWDESGTVTSSDEWIELYNDGASTVNLTGWSIIINDSISTNATIHHLNESISQRSYTVIMKPEGGLNNNGQIQLYNNLGVVVDSVTYGTWNDGNLSDNAPDGNADNISNECLARIPNGQDTDSDVNDFMKMACTYRAENSDTNQSNQTSENQQSLNVTIGDIIALRIYPTTLNFGVALPGTNNNPSLSGPIVFDANGSNTNVNVEVNSVSGFPFEQGLRVDAKIPTDISWQLECIQNGFYCTYNLKTAIPTLNVPAGSIAGTNQGTVTYLVTGTPPA